MVLVLAVSLIVNGCKKDTTGLVAQVNKVDVLEEMYSEELEIQRTIYKKQYGEEFLLQVDAEGQTRDQKLRQEVLDRLIIEELITQSAKEKEVNVSEEEIEERFEMLKDSIGGEEQYKEFLNENGISEEYFKENTRKDILMGRYYEKHLEEIEIKQEDVERFFEENKEELVVISARHILLNNEEHAKEVLERVKSGEEFEDVALTESLDSGSAAQGGDLGYFVRAKMIKEFSDAAFNLEIGEISGLVKTEVGYHIIKLEDKKESLNDFKEQIVMILKQDDYYAHLEELKNKADIEIFIDFEKVEDGNKDEEEKISEEQEIETKKEDK